MNFGFDIDGTITATPRVYAAMMKALRADGHQCFVITGTMDAVATPDHYEKRRMQLRRYEVNDGEHYDFLEVVVAPHAENKAKFCRDNKIVLMFEDSVEYAREIRKVTTCLMMN